MTRRLETVWSAVFLFEVLPAALLTGLAELARALRVFR